MNQKTPRTQPGSSPPLLSCSEAACLSAHCSPGSGACLWPLSLHRPAFPNSFAQGPLSVAPKCHPQSQRLHLLPARHPLIQPKIPISQERGFDCLAQSPAWSLLGQPPPPECRQDRRGPAHGGGQFSGKGMGLVGTHRCLWSCTAFLVLAQVVL